MKRPIHLNLKIWFTIMLLLNVFIVQQSRASHSMGADLTYECLGGNTYKITLSFYRDCIGIPAPVNPFININSTSCGQSLGVTAYARAGTGQEITPACSSAVTTCQGGSFTGIQEYVYDGIVTLPMQCTDWVFSYNLCCRNAAITTITTPGTSTFYIYATLNNTISPCNSSPTFSNKPVPFLCVGQQYCFNHGANDSDGDSLAYSLITPKQTSTSTVNYIAPYNATNPLNSVPATTFNAFTGDICLTPQALQVSVMAVLVKEYRNGVLIGSVERDMQLTVMNCANNLPTLTGINGTTDFNMTVCAGQPFCFDIFSNDVDGGQHLTVTWDNGIQNGTFTQGAGLNPTSTFCWTPTAADISATPHVFTARVADDACPYIGSQIYSYSITVIGINVDAGPDQDIACSDLATLTATASGGSGTYTYLWSNGSTMQSITVSEGTYIVTANDGTCSANDTVIVAMPFKPTAAFTISTTSCFNYDIHFIDQSTTPGGILNYWYWDFGDSATSTIQNPFHQYVSPGTYNVTLIVGNTLGCYDTLVQPIDINPPPVVDFIAPDGCTGTTITFIDLSTGGEGVSFWHWDFGDSTTSTDQNPDHTFGSPGTHIITLIAGDSLGCVDTAYRSITIFPVPAVNAGPDQSICAGNSATLTATGGGNYYWTTTNDTTPTIVVTPGTTTNYNVTVDDANGCIASDMVTVIINPLPVADAGPDKTTCLGNSVTLTATGGTTYSWNPGGSNSPTITVTPGGAITYTVTVTDANGCTATDSAHVSVNPLPTAGVSPDANICSGSSTTLTASGGSTYTWIPNGATTSTTNVSPTSTTTYTAIVSDGNGCSDSASVTVTVHQPPVVTLQSFFICNGATATLDAGNPGATYVWSTGASTQVITIITGGTYSVTVTDAYGCSAGASCTIISGTSISINLGNVSFCQGDSATLDAGYPGMTYLWSPGGETTQTVTIHSGGTYGVTVTDTSGCSGSITTTVIVNPIPVANFTATSICEGNATTFTDGSFVSTGSISSWWWNFGDGNVSAQQNPTHLYGSAGTYQVTLTIATAGGCTDSVTNTITVNPLPVAGFNFVNACLSSSVVFTDISTVSPGNITSFAWDFGDGFISSAQNPTHQYASAGNYNVALQVTTAGGCTNSITRTITVYPLPVADFTATTVCSGNQTVFTNTSSISTGSITSYTWDFGDSYTSTLQQPNHTYASSGTFNVSLIVTSSNGCTDTIVKPVTVYSLPVANAGSDQGICSGSSATLTATGGTSYSWTPGGFTTSTVSVNPSSNTTYTVTVTDGNGCQSTDNVNVIINPLPVANAGPDRQVCAGGSATLNASGGLTYSWNPGGSTNPVITVTPASTTNYIVTVTDGNGCQATDTTKVIVNPLPLISAGPDQTICTGSTISVSASGGVSYVWNPGSFTTPSILVTPPGTTDYMVTGTDGNGCQASDTMHVTVNPTPVVNIPPTLLCSGYSSILDAGNAGSTYLWSTGETTRSISVTDSGAYSVIVTNAFGCAVLGNAYVILAGSFNSNPNNVSTCTGQSATLDAGNPGCTYVWNTGATTQTISVSTAGSYFVTVTDPNGCSAVLYSNVSMNPIPNARFAATAACNGSATSFTDQSTVSSGTIQSYSWDFGDGFSSVLRNPNHIYQGTGVYNVTLSVTSSSGCSASVSYPVTVNNLPVADFSATTVCKNQSTAFNDLSTIASGTIVSWSWNFGDATVSSSLNPVHTYNNSGSFNVSLVVTSQNGCSDTVSKNITVKGLPVAAFSATNVCAQSAVQLNNLSTSGNGTITGYSWNFGDGNTSVAVNPANVYTADGTYNIKLVVTSSLGCADTVIHPVTIYPLPHADFATNPVCENTPATLINNSTVSSGSVTSMYWNFGDGSSSNQLNPSHTFLNDGTYNVTLIATTNQQCRDTVTQSLVIHPLPVASFQTQDVCVNSPATFADLSTISAGSVVSWSWSFGDNTASTSGRPTHVFTTPGTYDVTLTVTSNNGCSDSYDANINIFPDPVAEFSATNVCFSNATQLFNQSTVAGGSGFTSIWDFGDNTAASTLANPAHTFANPGSYNVLLTVTSQNGCSNQIMHNLRVYLGPVVSFNANSGCLGIQTVFLDNTNAMDGAVTGWLWNFGDGTTSNSNSPGHMYADTGNYDVLLTCTTEYGCVSSAARTVDIFPLPAPDISSTNECLGTPIAFADVPVGSGSAGENYLWDFSDGHTSTDSATTHTFVLPGTYDVQLIASNSFGCFASDRASVTVYPEPAIAFNAAPVCFPSTTQFNNTSAISNGSIQNYYWNFGDGTNTAQTNPMHAYQQAGTFYASLVGTSDHGCVSSDSQLVKINASPEANFGSSLRGCSPLRAGFSDSSSITQGTISGWLWEFGDGSVSTLQHPTHVFTQSGSYSVTLTIVSSEGCQATLMQPGFITVLPTPEAAFTVDPVVVDIIDPVVHFTNLSQGYTSYLWSFGDGTSLSNIISPTHIFSDTGSYSALLITVNSYGCSDTAYRRIDILPHSTLYAPNCFTPNGDGKNDTFQPAYTEMSNIQVWIFNRWGELLKSWDGLEGSWDGYYQGKACEDDVYVYRIKGLGDDGKNYEWTGHVSIIH